MFVRYTFPLLFMDIVFYCEQRGIINSFFNNNLMAKFESSFQMTVITTKKKLEIEILYMDEYVQYMGCE